MGISTKNLILAQTAAFAFLIGDADACREKVQLSHLGGCQDSDGRADARVGEARAIQSHSQALWD